MLELMYVNFVGKNSNENYVYEFYFSEEADMAWGIDWDVKPSSICNISVPQKLCYDIVKTIKCDILLNVAQKNSCFSMQDSKDGIIPLAWENIDFAEEYPEDGRLIFPFAISIGDVETILARRNILFDENND